MWHDALLVKLHRKGITGHFWHLISTWYSECTSCVVWEGNRSSSFILRQGVRQGGTLSPFLYLVFVDELLDLGACIGSIYCGAPMYADDLALVASSPGNLQAMLDLVYRYAQKWHYELNTTTSVVMVFGEAAVTRRRERAHRNWLLGEASLREVDETHHLGILRCVSSSTVSRTNERATACRSAFFALNSVGSRFGSLHPLTSLKLYEALCHPILLYGSEIWTLTKSELLFLERVQRRVLRTIQGLPVRCPSTCLTKLLGVISIEDSIIQRSLGFIVATANLPVDSLARQVLVARANSPGATGVVKRYGEILEQLNLPDLPALLAAPPKTSVWKAHVKRSLALRAHVEFMEICGSLLLGSCDLKLLKPAPHWKVTLGDPALTRLNNFRICLLVGCDGLEQDASRFRRRTTGAPRSDASCKLCGHTPEDAAHFVVGCHPLEDARSAALAVAPPSISKILPCRVVDPLKFTELILGTCWIDDAAFQSFCITYLSRLKARRTELLCSNSGPN